MCISQKINFEHTFMCLLEINLSCQLSVQIFWPLCWLIFPLPLSCKNSHYYCYKWKHMFLTFSPVSELLFPPPCLRKEAFNFDKSRFIHLQIMNASSQLFFPFLMSHKWSQRFLNRCFSFHFYVCIYDSMWVKFLYNDC